MLNKIKWDPRENPKDYTVFYLDRITRKLIEIKFGDIVIENTFMGFGEAMIPLHRIKRVKMRDKIIWER